VPESRNFPKFNVNIRYRILNKISEAVYEIHIWKCLSMALYKLGLPTNFSEILPCRILRKSVSLCLDVKSQTGRGGDTTSTKYLFLLLCKERSKINFRPESVRQLIQEGRKRERKNNIRIVLHKAQQN
jgi:hypothetical protein